MNFCLLDYPFRQKVALAVGNLQNFYIFVDRQMLFKQSPANTKTTHYGLPKIRHLLF